MPMTNYLRKALGDEALGKVAFTMPAAVFLGLHTADPGDSGSTAAEVTGGSYARVSITASMGTVTLATGISVSTADIQFAAPTADWGVVSYISISDASSAGNMLYRQALTSPRSVLNGGRRVTFLAGQLQVQLV
jgi:hypothetical protein